MNAMEAVRDTFSTTVTIADEALCLFRGEQRAVGEIMLRENEGGGSGDVRWDCLGYAAFITRLEDPAFDRWFTLVRRSLTEDLLDDLPAHGQRLIQLQNDLVDLIELIDPNQEQVPGELRKRLAA